MAWLCTTHIRLYTCVNVWYRTCARKATTVLCSYAHITPRANTIINSAFLNIIIILLLIINISLIIIIIIDTIMDNLELLYQFKLFIYLPCCPSLPRKNVSLLLF